MEEKDYSKGEISKHMNIFHLLNFICSIVILIISNYEIDELTKSNKEDMQKYIICYIGICVLVILKSIYEIICEIKSVRKNIKIEMLEENNKNLLEVNDQVRCFKHDFNNIIQTLDSCIDVGDMETLSHYSKSLIKECNYMNSIDRLNSKAKENPAIYSILVNKYRLAEERNINMNIDVLVDLRIFKNKSYKVSRMLGILIDNALEASSECNEKLVTVQFFKESESNNKISIIIANTYKDKNIDTDKIFEKNYTTKKGKGNSGLGLWKIKDIIKKDTAFDLYTTKDSNMFKQQLEFYDMSGVNFVLK